VENWHYWGGRRGAPVPGEPQRKRTCIHLKLFHINQFPVTSESVYA
jgi:hypothetical protein